LLTAYGVIDKLGRDSRDQSRAKLQELGLNESAVRDLFNLFEQQNIEALADRFGTTAGVSEHVQRLQAYFRALADLGLAEYVRFDPTIVRGLAYYTGIVFEIFDRQGELRAICGGGRYDALLRTVSDVDLPSCGFGMGDVVLGELLKDRGLLPAARTPLDYYLIAVGAEQHTLQRRIAQALRSKGHSVTYGFGAAGVGKQFKDADARGARAVIVLGPSEVEQGVVVVREMASGQEQRVQISELVEGYSREHG
jgi:histidyl-tRNA synthetase